MTNAVLYVAPDIQVPEIHRIGGIKIRFFHLVFFKQEMTVNRRAGSTPGVEHKSRNVVTGNTEEQVWVDQITLEGQAIIGSAC